MSSCDIHLNDLDKGTADRIKGEFEDFKNKYGISENDNMAKKLGEMFQEKARKIEMTKRERLLSTQKYEKFRASVMKGLSVGDNEKGIISKTADKVRKKFQTDTEFKAGEKARDVVKFSKKVEKRVRQQFQNIQDRGNAIHDQGIQFLAKHSEDKAMRKLMETDDFQRDIYRAITEPDKYKFADDSPVGMMSKSIQELNDWMHVKKSQAGFDIGYRKGYVAKQLHNYDKIKAAEDLWTSTMKRDVNWEKMGFTSEDKINEFLDKTYADITKREPLIDNQFVELTQGTTKSMDSSRTIIFKDADIAFNYQKQFGSDNLFDQLQKSLRVDSGKVAMGEVMSTRHEANFKKMLGDFKGVMDDVVYEGMEREAKGAYKLLTGKSSFGSAKTFTGKSATGLRQMADMSLLKATSLLTTVTDTSLGAGVLNEVLGGGKMGYAKKFTTSAMDTVKLFADKKLAREYASRFGVYAAEASSMGGQKFAREGVETGGSWKFVNKMHNFMMAATGLPKQALAARLATAKQVVIGLADIADTKFDNLYSGTKQVFEDLNISADDWDVIRTSGMDELDDFKMLSANKLRENGHLELSSKYASMIRQVAELGSPTSSLRLNVVKNMHSPDSLNGVLMRTMLQYKSFPIAALRTMQKIGAGDNAIANVAMTASMGTALGATVIQMRSYANKGKFKDMTSGNFWVEAFDQSGTSGQLGAMLTADYSKGYRTPLADAAGPVPAIINSVGEIGAKAVRGKKVGKDAKRFLWQKATPSVIGAPILWKKFFEYTKEL